MAEDIVQSAFIKTFERITQFREDTEFRPWFLRSVINDALMAIRHAGYTSSLNEAWDMAISLPDVEASLDEMLIARETSESIWDALGDLTARQRTAIVMHYYLGMSEAEIAASLECPPGTVKSRLHSARQRMRQLLPVWLSPATPAITSVEKKP
jgi:RNA polymerase sigma-70 factor (ECF subfamily)